MKRISIMDVYGFFQRPFRKRRLGLFRQMIPITPGTRILDVGGNPWFWNDLGVPSKVTLLNPEPFPEEVVRQYCNFDFVTADGCRLPYADRSFDVGFSNSAIEHVGAYERQRAFASEIRRVGRALWVQTPAREFPVEPHLMAPFFQYLPPWLQRRTLRHLTIFGLLTKPGPPQVEQFLREVRLLRYREMRALFPDCEIRRERALGLTKSYVAIRNPL
jgi:hypothetical protein